MRIMNMYWYFTVGLILFFQCLTPRQYCINFTIQKSNDQKNWLFIFTSSWYRSHHVYDQLMSLVLKMLSVNNCQHLFLFTLSGNFQYRKTMNQGHFKGRSCGVWRWCKSGSSDQCAVSAYANIWVWQLHTQAFVNTHVQYLFG